MIPPRPQRADRALMPGAWWAAPHRLWSRRFWRALIEAARVPLAPYGQAWWAHRSLILERGERRPRSRKGVVVVATYLGEADLLAAFLAHHRGLGIGEFVFLDISAAGDLAQVLGEEPDCTVWRPRDDWRGMGPRRWLNHLRHRYADGRWCLSLEPTDLFVYYRCETRPIQGLIDFLDSEHRDHVYALVIDLYGDRPASEMALAPGENPLAKLPFFDPFGYVTPEPDADRRVAVRGGLLRRALFRGAPAAAPPISRIALVKWRTAYAYIEGTHLMRPNRLNTPHGPWHSSPTACLLRLRLLCPEIVRPEPPEREAEASLRQRALCTEASRRYTDSGDLVDTGLLNPGQWF